MPAKKFGFRDLRTAAELALAPGVPVSVKVGRINVSAVLPIPQSGKIGQVVGAIRKASDLAGAAYQEYRRAVQTTKEMQALASNVKESLQDFEKQAKALLKGDIPIQDISQTASMMVQRGLATGQFFQASDLVQLSGFKPGDLAALGPAQVQAAAQQLNQRRKEIQDLYNRVSKAVTDLKKNGPNASHVQENYDRKPNPQSDGPTTSAFAQGTDEAQQTQVAKDKKANEVKGVKKGSGKPSFWARVGQAAQTATRVASQASSVASQVSAYAKDPNFNPALKTIFADKQNANGGWSEPASPAAPRSPHNNAIETPAGHLFELDSTPGAERIHVYHRSGSFAEFHPDGKVVHKSTNHAYTITLRDHHISIDGDCHLHVGGQTTVHAKGDLHIEADKDLSIKANGKFDVRAKEINLLAKTKAKVDGTTIDLRYVQLPGIPVAGWNGIAPALNLAALAADFPEAAKTAAAGLKTFQQAAASAASSANVAASGFNPLSAISAVPKLVMSIGKIAKMIAGPALGVAAGAFAFKALSSNDAPKETPLGNPLVYHRNTQDAVKYRALLLDTPDELRDTEQYQAHLELRKTLGDVANNYTNIIPGKRTTYTTNIVAPDALPNIDYLDRSTFTNAFTANTVLGNTSFTVKQLADSLAAPDVANYITPEPEVTSNVATETVVTLASLTAATTPTTPAREANITRTSTRGPRRGRNANTNTGAV